NSGAVAQNIGDVGKAMATAATKVEVTYQVPFLARATMEPINCTVRVRKDGCEVWVGLQVVARVQAAAAKTAGLPCLLRQLKRDGPAGFLLPHRRAIDRIPTRCNVLDPKCDDIAAPQLAVDCEIEHRQVPRPPVHLQPGA